MGALYEDVENFFGDIFAWYGRRVARRPLPFLIVPLLACSLVGLGLFNIHYESDLENLYTPVNSRAIQVGCLQLALSRCPLSKITSVTIVG